MFEDKKRRLWWADRLKLALLAALLLFGMLAYAGSELCFFLMFVVLMGFFGVEFFMNRCPHCDRYLGRDAGLFCQHCGGPIREDRPDT